MRARAGVLEVEVLVLELVPVDRDAPRPVALDKVAPLTHKPLDDPMERAALVAYRLAGLAAVRRARSAVSTASSR